MRLIRSEASHHRFSSRREPKPTGRKCVSTTPRQLLGTDMIPTIVHSELPDTLAVCRRAVPGSRAKTDRLGREFPGSRPPSMGPRSWRNPIKSLAQQRQGRRISPAFFGGTNWSSPAEMPQRRGEAIKDWQPVAKHEARRNWRDGERPKRRCDTRSRQRAKLSAPRS